MWKNFLNQKQKTTNLTSIFKKFFNIYYLQGSKQVSRIKDVSCGITQKNGDNGAMIFEDGYFEAPKLWSMSK